ncbi:MAG TPA: DNA-processing protein DprA [Cellulomonas sp.]
MTGWDDDLVARATWSALAEPGDAAAGALVRTLGARGALGWVAGASRGSPDWVALPDLPGSDRMRLVGAAQRWSARSDSLDARAMLEGLDRAGGTLVGPGTDAWPTGLDDLGDAAPFVLWCRGAPPGDRPAVAVVGSRASTGYGERVAYDISEALARQGVAVVSGGAYGIDAAAHRGAIAGGGPTVVVLAGGVDRGYPAGNARLFEEAVASGGSVVSEVPPGALPMKSRFLQRNRLIAAAAGATVVVEAAWRSGALSTAHHAADLLRPVGAVPGPVTSVASAGCHRLLREGAAVCVTDVDEVLELLPGRPGHAGGLGAPSGGAEGLLGQDDAGRLDPLSRRVHDALGLRAGAPDEIVAERAGVGVAEARSALGLLELAGVAARSHDGWRAVRPRSGMR